MQHEFVKLLRTKMRSTENQLDVKEGNTESHNDSSEDSEANETEHVNRTFKQ